MIGRGLVPQRRLARVVFTRLQPTHHRSVRGVPAALVLCSVPTQATALAEVRRVLKPGGRLLVVEHVPSGDPTLARRQDGAERLQMFLAGGCHPNRDTAEAIRCAGFDLDGIASVELPVPRTVRPGICGWARSPADVGRNKQDPRS